MSNIRFLDNVSVSSFAGSTQEVGSAFPRFVLAGETKIVPTNVSSYAFDVYNLGTIKITAGSAIQVGGETLFTHGLLRVETNLENEGIINNEGIIEIGIL